MRFRYKIQRFLDLHISGARVLMSVERVAGMRRHRAVLACALAAIASLAGIFNPGRALVGWATGAATGRDWSIELDGPVLNIRVIEVLYPSPRVKEGPFFEFGSARFPVVTALKAPSLSLTSVQTGEANLANYRCTRASLPLWAVFAVSAPTLLAILRRCGNVVCGGYSTGGGFPIFRNRS